MSENSLTTAEIIKTVESQRAFFKSGATLGVGVRHEYLKRLYRAIKDNLGSLHGGLYKDLGKCESESYMCETGLALSEISYLLKHLKKFCRPRRVKTPLSQFSARSMRIPSPYGTVLIMNPWNYPVLLSLEPLAEAVAAGNTVVLKLSAYSPESTAAIKQIIESVFPREYVSVIFGGREANETLINTKFDYVFFTGSKAVGKLVYEKCATNLTPVTLELGGKSPCIVDATADIPLSAKRIVWGKYLNAGQTCVAPDYILCDVRIRDRLIAEIRRQIALQFGENPLSDPSYGKIISRKHFDRVLNLIDAKKVVHGGKSDEESLKIEPTVLDGVTWDDAVMQEEIFGPVLPVLVYRDEHEIYDFISSRDEPLALYVFSSDKARIKRLLSSLKFGGGCVNDVVVHLASPYLPFGGFGASGTGAYHGKAGFDTFTHYKSVVRKSTHTDLNARYRPYKKSRDKIIKRFLH